MKHQFLKKSIFGFKPESVYACISAQEQEFAKKLSSQQLAAKETEDELRNEIEVLNEKLILANKKIHQLESEKRAMVGRSRRTLGQSVVELVENKIENLVGKNEVNVSLDDKAQGNPSHMVQDRVKDKADGESKERIQVESVNKGNMSMFTRR